MTQFKVGDRVRWIHGGEEGTVISLASILGEDSADVEWDGAGTALHFVGDLELVEEQPGPTCYEATPVDPDHYKFPGGAEVIHISQWLTANAAQALQYVARSSRIDGKNKGDASEDIRKAITFLEFELKRLDESK